MKTYIFFGLHYVGKYTDKITDFNIIVIPIQLIYKCTDAKLCGQYFSRKEIPTIRLT
jgi:hypothetical protein